MSKEKTDTSPSPNLSEILSHLCAELAKANINVADALEKSGFGSRTDVALARLIERDDDALVLITDIKLVSKRGILSNIVSENTVPGALDPLMLGTAHGSLAKMIDASIVVPLLASFQNFATREARAHKEEKSLLEFSDDDESGDIENLFGK